MSPRERWVRFLSALGLLLVTVGCGADGTGGPTGPTVGVAGLAKVTGDQQLRFPATPLVEPLEVALVDADGAGVARAGVVVEWRVVSGGGSVAPESPGTDASGAARAIWSLGSSAGPQRLEASIEGAPAVTFSAEARPPGPIVFGSTRAGGTPKLFVMQEDGSSVIQLTTGPAGDAQPRWSPDGARVAFVRTEDGVASLFVVADDGTGLERLTDEEARSPSWSPNGTEIAFARAEAIWVLDLEGRSERLIASSTLGDFDPDWSPDGSAIAFSRRTRAVPPEAVLRTVAPDGSGLAALTTLAVNDAAEHMRPRWSPDGSDVMYEYRQCIVCESIVTFLSGPIMIVGERPGSWSPDGLRVLTVGGADEGQPPDIWVVDLERSRRQTPDAWTNLTNDLAIDGAPDWRR